jgi:MHS family proline/betaine transporter-like MFS transporter
MDTTGIVRQDLSQPHQSIRRTALAGLIGNVMEWFRLCGLTLLRERHWRAIFSAIESGAQQLLTFAVFGIGFVGRPFGSLVLGAVGDRIGRRALLVLSIRANG